MKTTIVANGSNDKLVMIPESDIERAWAMALGKNEGKATIVRGQYQAIGAASPEMAVIITVPHTETGDDPAHGGGVRTLVKD